MCIAQRYSPGERPALSEARAAGARYRLAFFLPAFFAFFAPFFFDFFAI